MRKKNLCLTEDLCRALVEGFDLLDAMLQRVGDQQFDEKLNDGEQGLLDRVAKLELDARGARWCCCRSVR